MRVIIAGSRDFNDYDKVKKHCVLFQKKFGPITEVVSGTARGADRLGERWAHENNVPVHQMPAEWDKYGKSAGYRRNEAMAECADALIAFNVNNSKGTGHMIDIASHKGLQCYVVKIYVVKITALASTAH